MAELVKELVKVNIDGYELEYDKAQLDDVEVLEMIEEMQNGKPTMIITFLKTIVGESTYQDMKDYFVKKDGRMKITKLQEVFEKLFEDFDLKG